jgi:hypothetical protein
MTATATLTRPALGRPDSATASNHAFAQFSPPPPRNVTASNTTLAGQRHNLDRWWVGLASGNSRHDFYVVVGAGSPTAVLVHNDDGLPGCGQAGSGESVGGAESPVLSSPFQVHIDPNGGPMAIDTSNFSGESTLNGGVRNARAFWKAWGEQYPETLSSANVQRIGLGRSPVVDEQWVESFPETEDNMSETLAHHHLDCGPSAIPLPASVHGENPGYSIWHSTC